MHPVTMLSSMNDACFERVRRINAPRVATMQSPTAMHRLATKVRFKVAVLRTIEAKIVRTTTIHTRRELATKPQLT
jgi:hypothetical protein